MKLTKKIREQADITHELKSIDDIYNYMGSQLWIRIAIAHLNETGFYSYKSTVGYNVLLILNSDSDES